MRPNYNYNYNYAVTPSSVEKPHSAHVYSNKSYQNKLQNQSTAHYIIQGQPPVKYYPINEDQPAFRTVHSAKESATSFYVNTHQKQSNNKYQADFATTTKSPKSHQNWYIPQNSASQLSVNTNSNNNSRYVNLLKQKEIPTDAALDSYVNWLQTAFSEFEKTGNVKTLKHINQQNSLEIKKLHQQLLNQRQTSSNSNTLPKSNTQISLTPGSSPRPKTSLNSQRLSQLKQQLLNLQNQSTHLTSLIVKQTHISQQLQQQYENQIQSREDSRLDQSHIRQSNHLKQMQESITELQEQIKTIERKNNELTKSVIGLPFFKEWSIMFDEAKGATKLNLKLKHQIVKRQTLIKELTNEDPSNNSDARSVRRLPSQSGQRPASFNKKQPKSIPTSLTKPQSQFANKFNQKPDSSRSNDVVIRHLSHSNRFSQSKKSTVNNSVDKTKQRKQSYDQKPYLESNNNEWKPMGFPQNLKNIGINFIGKEVYK